MALQPIITTVPRVPLINIGTPAIRPDTDVAFAHRGAQAAVFRPHFGQAHQQYFTPRWLSQACADIAERLFDVPVVDDQRGGYPLRVIDLTCGSGRLLASFAERGHQVLGIELDDRLVPVARRAVGKDHVRKGDICAYAPAIPTRLGRPASAGKSSLKRDARPVPNLLSDYMCYQQHTGASDQQGQ